MSAQSKIAAERGVAGRAGSSRGWRARTRLAACAALMLIGLAAPIPKSMAAAAVPPGVWLMGEDVAIQIFDCTGMLCARIIWLKAPLNLEGLLRRDPLNPDPALRERQICGPTIIWNVRPTDSNRWTHGWFYNPEDGKTYRVNMVFESDDVIVARLYSGLPIFGQTRTLVRVPQGTSEGWC